MTTFAERYQASFAALGQPLKPSQAMKEKDLLGLPLPAALRDYYLGQFWRRLEVQRRGLRG